MLPHESNREFGLGPLQILECGFCLLGIAEMAEGGALKVAAREAMSGKTVVTLLPDMAERYLSTALFDGIEE